MNLYYIAIFIVLPLVISIYLLDVIWIKKISLTINDQKITSGIHGLIQTFKIAFSKDKI